jgi:vacuolar protein sorting-associated protein 13A/C
MRRSLELFLEQPGKSPLQFMSSAEESGAQDKDLLVVKYKRAQREGPEFETLFGGMDQNIDVEISTFNFHAAPEPVISLYNFVMTTFVPPPADQPEGSPESEASEGVVTLAPGVQKPSLIHVLVKLAGVRCMCPTLKHTQILMAPLQSFCRMKICAWQPYHCQQLQ